MDTKRKNSERRVEMLKNGPIAKTLFTFALPAVLGMVVMAVYNLVDAFFVGLLRDTTAIAATGIVFPVFQLVGAIGLTFGMGAASVISRRLGENNREDAQRTAATAFYSSMVIGVMFAVVGAIFTEPIMRMFGATESIIESATLYARVILGGSVFQVMNMCINNILRSEGAAVRSGAGQVLGAVLNIILDPIFIFVFDMGVTGAAVATVIAQATSFAFLVTYYLRNRGVLHATRIRDVTLSIPMFAGIMTLGLPTFTRQILGSVSAGLINNAAGEFGDSAIAAVSISARSFMILMMALFGLSQGLQPLAGYNYGARNFDRVRSSLRTAATWALILALIVLLVFLLFAPGIMRAFAPQDPTVIDLGTTALRLLAIGLIPIAAAVMFGGFFQAVGEGKAALFLALGQQGLFLIPFILVLPRLLGVVGVMAAQPFAFATASFVAVLLLRGVLRKMRAAELHPAAPSADSTSVASADDVTAADSPQTAGSHETEQSASVSGQEVAGDIEPSEA